MWAMSLSFFSAARKGSTSSVALGILGVAILLIVLFFVGRASRGSGGNGIVLYYGDGCPHCAIVEEFLQKNKQVEQKVTFTRKEVYNNKRNAREMRDHAETCGMPTDSIGVPFLWTGSSCLTGDKDIIDFFQKKL